MYSLLSPAIVLMPDLRAGLGSIWRSARLDALVAYGEGPHVMSLTLLMLALLAFHVAMEKGGALRVCLAAVAIAAVALTNWLGTFALALLIASYLMSLGVKARWLRTALIGVIAYTLAVTWIPPSTIRGISYNAQYVVGSYPLGWKQLLLGTLVLGMAVALRWALARAGVSLFVRVASLFTIFPLALVLADVRLGISLMPQARRYHLEMEMGLLMVVAFAGASLIARFHKSAKIGWAVAAMALGVAQVRNYRAEARRLIQPIDVTRTVEYQVSTMLDHRFPNQRIYTAGSTAFWLSAFSDNLQVGGGFDQGIVNRLIPKLDFGIPFTQHDGPRTATWLRVLGAQAVLVSGPQTRDSYKDWHDPGKFAGLLPEIWRNGDDVVYSVPQRSASLAHVIRPEHVVRRTPLNVEDDQPIQPLAAGLEDTALPSTQFEWISPSEARIMSQVEPGQLLFVQITYHPGWHAAVGGEGRAIQSDALGFMIIDPVCHGPCEVKLRFNGGTEMALARATTVLAILGCVAWLAYERRRRSLPSGGTGDGV